MNGGRVSLTWKDREHIQAAFDDANSNAQYNQKRLFTLFSDYNRFHNYQN